MSNRLSVGEIRNRIETFFEDQERDVVCRKKKHVYSIYWADDREPLVRFRLTGRQDQVEVFWWNGDHWAAVTDFGRVLPLDEALQYVAQDPHGLFFDSEGDLLSEGPYGPRRTHRRNEFRAQVIAMLHVQLIAASALGGAIGALLAGSWSAMACGAPSGFLLFLLISLYYRRHLNRTARKTIWVLAIPCSVVAALGAAIGGAANAGASGGMLGSGIGAVVAFLACILLMLRPWTAWCVGFVAALAAVVAITTRLGVRDHFLGILAAALCAALAAHLCATTTASYLRFVRPFFEDAPKS
jgi:hypothetical protein